MFCPLFSAFGPEPVAQRLPLGEAGCWSPPRALPERGRTGATSFPACEHVLVVGAGTATARRSSHALYERGSTGLRIGADRPRRTRRCCTSRVARPALPKGASTCTRPSSPTTPPAAIALDLHPDDVFWCTADPGWVTGTSYGIIAPLTHGVTIIDRRGRVRRRALVPHPRRTAGHGLVHRADRAPHADAAGAEPPREHDLSALRLVASVGEPLNPEAVVWGQEALGLPVHDNWWQTETGGDHDRQLPRRMDDPARLDGPPDARVSRPRSSPAARTGGTRVGRRGPRVTDAEARASWPCGRAGPRCSAATSHDDERYATCFVGGWYLTGDLARRDADGYSGSSAGPTT